MFHSKRYAVLVAAVVFWVGGVQADVTPYNPLAIVYPINVSISFKRQVLSVLREYLPIKVLGPQTITHVPRHVNDAIAAVLIEQNIISTNLLPAPSRVLTATFRLKVLAALQSFGLLGLNYVSSLSTKVIAGATGPMGPQGPQGPPGPLGATNLPSGTVVNVIKGTAMNSSEWTLIGTTTQTVKDVNNKNKKLLIEVYQKN